MSYIHLPENNMMELKEHRFNDDEFNQKLLEEREEDIINISKNVNMVNTIFSNLSKLVAEQQENIDDIENSIDDSKRNTKDGVNQLEKASNYQKSCNKCNLYILCLMIIILTVIILVISLH